MVLVRHAHRCPSLADLTLEEKDIYYRIKSVLAYEYGVPVYERFCNEVYEAAVFVTKTLVSSEDVSNLTIEVETPVVAVIARAIFRALNIHALVKLKYDGRTRMRDLVDYINSLQSAFNLARYYTDD